MTTTLPETTDTASIANRARTLADSLRSLAGLIEHIDSEVVLSDYHYLFRYTQIPVDDKEALAAHIRAGLTAGAKVEKYFRDKYAGVNLSFGPVRVCMYADRNAVCERVVVGTREVTEEVPDPDALAAVPKVTVTRVEEQVEWVCNPLLAGGAS